MLLSPSSFIVVVSRLSPAAAKFNDFVCQKAEKHSQSFVIKQKKRVRPVCTVAVELRLKFRFEESQSSFTYTWKSFHSSLHRGRTKIDDFFLVFKLSFCVLSN